MLSASLVFALLTVGICALRSSVRFSAFLSPFPSRLHWTLGCGDWTIRRQRALLVPFHVQSTCKSALAARPTTLRQVALLFYSRIVRYGAWGRAVAGRVVVPQRVTSGAPELKSAQRRALLALESEPGTSLTRSEYERLTGVGRSQAAYDLSELVSAGRLVRVGGGRSTRYVLAHEPASQRRWTPDRIRRELEAFCADRSGWPTASEFKTAGRGDLYVAASRYGGVAYWANELGLDRSDRSRTTVVSTRAPLRSRLAWSFAGALAAGALAAAAVTAVIVTHRLGSSGKTGATASASLQSSHRIFDEPLRLPRATATGHAHAVTRPRVTRPASRAPSTPAQQGSLVSEHVQTSSPHTASPTGHRVVAAASNSGSPAPLPAPSGASAPSALQAP